jgi:alpha-2-macroglobulin
LLAAAYALSGDKGSQRFVLPKEFAGEQAGRATGGSFYSYIRDEALALGTLLETEPESQQIGIMAKHLSEALRRDRYLNTQENAFALVALGKVARKVAQTLAQTANANPAAAFKATIVVAGKTIPFTGADILLTSRELPGAQVSISVAGTGTLYYFWETEGLAVPTSGAATGAAAMPEEDSFLRVRRTFLDRTGKPFAPDGIKQNDLVVVKLTLQTTNGAPCENVVLTDMLPAGLEIENPRISAVPELSWIKDNTEPQNADIRDDRMLIFARADGTSRNYYYLCRAVSKGAFRLGPVTADAMYNGEYHSLSGAGMLRIGER